MRAVEYRFLIGKDEGPTRPLARPTSPQGNAGVMKIIVTGYS